MNKKISVLLVDDEELVMADIKSIYDWQANGFEIIDTAVNGKQALAKFIAHMPQVVITDIRMPFMDGLELIREIRKINKTTKIIMLTAYDEFDYIKKAVTCELTDYILKSEMQPAVWKEKLTRVKKEIEENEKVSGILEQSIIFDVFSRDLGPEQLAGKYDNAILQSIQLPRYYLLVTDDVPLPIVSEPMDSSLEPTYLNVLSGCIGISREGVAVEYCGRVFGNAMLLMLSSGNDHSLQVQATLKKIAGDIQKHIAERYGKKYTFFMVPQKMNLLELRKLFWQNRRRILAKYLTGHDKVYDFLDRGLDLQHSGITLKQETLLECLEEGHAEKVLDFIDQAYGKLVPPTADFEDLLTVSRQLYQILEFQVSQLGNETEELDLSLEPNKMHWLDAEGIKEWMKEKFIALMHALEWGGLSRYSPEVARTIKYIWSHYMDKDMANEQVAREAGLSESHLSVVFKKEIGDTINAYTTDIRISKAKKMLKEGYRVYEVAQKVGYGSSQYFSQVFYTKTGMSPVKYKKSGKK